MKKIIYILFLFSFLCSNAQNVESISYYKNGKIKSFYSYVNDKKEGPFETYTKEGKIYEKGTMKNNKRNGLCYSYFYDGFREERHYKNGLLHGTLKVYYANGKLAEEKFYQNNNLTGLFSSYYSTGQLKEKGTYKAIYKDGTYKKSLKTGDYKAYLPSGKIMISGTYVIDENNESIKYGIWQEKTYYNFDAGDLKPNISDSDLKIKEDLNLFNYDYHGICKTYYENGQLETIYNYNLGEANGECKTYYENGQLETICNYKLGEEDGVYKEYSKDGVLIEYKTYNAGELNGLVKVYNYDGEITLKGDIKNGKRDGIWFQYDEENNEKAKILYNNGEIVKYRFVNSINDPLHEPYYKIMFKNKCHKTVEIAVRYRNLDGNWESKGFFIAKSNEKVYVANTDNRIIYYWASSEDGTLGWSGEHTKTVRGIKLKFREKEIPKDKSFGEYYVDISCNN